MKTIKLTRGFEAKVDDVDYERVIKYVWHVKVNKTGKMYARRSDRIYLHRFLINPQEGYEVDHVDGNGLNCCRENLRECTHSQNNMNKAKHVDNQSGYKGVHWSIKDKTWIAKIFFEGKEYRLGSFHSKEMAAWAYNHAAKMYFGEFAYLNEVKCNIL